MGAYLSVPDTVKRSSNDKLERLSYGASSMQGWRATQEDAHNCIPEFDDNVSLFAVYDGHGGAEVAQYCSMHFPDYIKSVPAYKNGNLAQALEDAFLGFDEMLTRPDVISELKVFSGVSDNTLDTENEVNHLYAEANMPLDQVLAKYGNDVPPQLTAASVSNPVLARLKEGKPLSPFLRAKSSGKGDGLKEPPIAMDLKEDGDKSEVVNGDAEADDLTDKSIVNGESDVLSTKKKADEIIKKKVDDNVKGQSCDDECSKDNLKSNRTSDGSSGDCPSMASSSSKKLFESPEQSGCSSGKSKRSVSKPVSATDDTSDDSSSEDDENYEGDDIPYADSSDSDEEDAEKKAADSSDDDDDEDDEDDDEDNSDEDDAEDYELDEEKEEPGSDSGCTAVVALLRGDCLYVANAGDSRCIVSRGGKAIDMSVDHKPEDELERNRIVAAGGTVTPDGRVDGGLNLSRAIGDHTYKQNKDIAAKDQMISALPDIRTLTIDPAEDEFMVLACDGIWNSMSSQEVADFVRERLEDGTDNMATICEAMFDRCLAANTRGDGTGCDNMTAIVVKFHKGLATATSSDRKKRELTEKLEQPAKRQRADDGADGGITTVQ